MDNFRPWALWRRTLYGAGFFSTWALVGTIIYFVNFHEPSNCFDGMLNGKETGVDCGGQCVRICAVDTIPPRVVWAESFEITPGQYNAVGYIENRNAQASTPELRYTFTFYSGSEIVGERSGVTVLPPNSSYPVFEGRVFTDGKEVTDTTLALESADMWLPASNDSSQFKTIDIDLQNPDDRPKLAATIENTALTAAEDIEVVATIFNDVGVAVTASETFIESFAPRSTKDIEFTWPQSIAKTVRSCSIPTDVVLGIDLSGSMNNDGANPPQPLTDALAAAESFIENLGDLDQVGVVSFASGATLEQSLTDLHVSAADLLSNLSITTEEETGYTNTSAAFDAAATELNSNRHSAEARRAFVILTDGLPTAEGDFDAEAAAITSARSLSVSGADVYAIGLGAAVNQNFIRSIASEESYAYLAPSRSDLEDIYAQITASLCEVGPTKIEVIAKTKTNFAPLR